MRKVKALHNSVQVQHVYESYFLLEKNPALSEVKRYVFDSLLKHHLTRDITFVLIRSCGQDVYEKEKRSLKSPETFSECSSWTKKIKSLASFTYSPSEGPRAARVCRISNPDRLIHIPVRYLYATAAGYIHVSKRNSVEWRKKIRTKKHLSWI